MRPGGRYLSGVTLFPYGDLRQGAARQTPAERGIASGLAALRQAHACLRTVQAGQALGLRNDKKEMNLCNN